VKNKTTRLFLAITFSLLVSVPSYGRGFGGGFGGFRGGGGDFDRGGFDRGGFGGGGFDRGGFDRGFDNADRAGVARTPESASNWNGVKNYDYGGGFNKIAQPEAMDHPNFNQFSAHNPSELSADNSFGRVAQNNASNFHPQNFDENNLSAQGENVRNSFNHNTNINNYGGYHNYNGYHPDYPQAGYHPYGGYGNHPYGAYGYHPYGGYGYHHYGFYGYPGGWSSAGLEASMWTCMGLTSLTSFLGIAAMSGNRNAGASNVTYEGGNTYINTLPAQDYYQQGQQLAGSAGGDAPANSQLTAMAQTVSSDTQSPTVTPAATQAWQPLGVYSLCEPGQKQSTTLFQLAINKDGVVRGNYMNQITNEKAQVHGALDKSTERISWTIGSNPQTVFSTTLPELMKKDSKVVVQFGPASTQQMSFIRIPEPKQTQSQNVPAATS
jgi:hypothetical protein